MNTDLFRQRLADLVTECGGRLLAEPQITLREPRNERFKGPSDMDSFVAVRGVQPFVIDIVVEADSVGQWHHISGDDRRLHPDLKAT